ncbi:MAG: hypothetical protein R3C19_03415 [Planctomycetaceae bacterium]
MFRLQNRQNRRRRSNARVSSMAAEVLEFRDMKTGIVAVAAEGALAVEQQPTAQPAATSDSDVARLQGPSVSTDAATLSAPSDLILAAAAISQTTTVDGAAVVGTEAGAIDAGGATLILPGSSEAGSSDGEATPRFPEVSEYDQEQAAEGFLIGLFRYAAADGFAKHAEFDSPATPESTPSQTSTPASGQDAPAESSAGSDESESDETDFGQADPSDLRRYYSEYRQGIEGSFFDEAIL